jgi:hypothetical protein
MHNRQDECHAMHNSISSAKVTEHLLFPTRVMIIEHAKAHALNTELLSLFRTDSEYQRDDLARKADHANLLDMAERCPAVERLRGLFVEAAQAWLRSADLRGTYTMRIFMFPNYFKQGGYVPAHNHVANLTGIYYVHTPSHEDRPVLRQQDSEYYWEQEPGVLLLHDPKFNANLLDVEDRVYAKVYPRPGLLVIFPGYLWHSVTPTNADRLAISANVTIERPEDMIETKSYSIVV